MKRRQLRRPAFRLHHPRFETLEERAVMNATAWSSFAGNSQHTSVSSVTSQPMEAVHWSTPVDNFPTSRAAHYGGPLITLNNTVIYPYKTGNTQSSNTPDFRVVARNGNDGSFLWDYSTPYVPASYSWYPGYQPVLATATNRVYFAGKGGTIYYRDNPDSANGTVTQLAFFGSMAHYQSNKLAYDDNVFIETPLTADNQGNIFFGFRVTGATPTNLVSGIARIHANGTVTTAAGIWRSATEAAGNDASIGSVQQNGAPAISNDGLTLYITVKGNGDGSTYGKLLGLSTSDLSTQFNSGVLKDPRGNNASILNISTSSPMVAPDGRVFLGVFGNPYNGSRGWMLQFSGDLQTEYTPGGFGWDTTPSIVPASLLGSSYTGTSQYLIFTKYNNYYFPNGSNDGGDGQNAIAILDPNATEVEFHHPEQNIQVMKRVLVKVGPTPDWDYPDVPTAVREWCINYGAVDIEKKSVIVNSSDGYFYRWNLETNTLVEPVQLTSGIGQPYTMTVIGVDGTLYGIQMGRLFALGETPKMSIGDVTLTEGNNGTVNATFQVSLNYPRTDLISVVWATADQTAKAGTDYTAASGTLVFDPGVKTRTITVAVTPDLLDELNETFAINLSSVGGAILVDAQGIATITDDDPQPALTIGDASINEGNSGTSSMEFVVQLSAASGQAITVNWATSNSTASSPTDYVAASGALTFAPGETSKTISVTVNGDTVFEPNENFFVTLSGAANASIGDNRGTGSIINDDGVPSLQINDASVVEGGILSFVVSLSNASSQAVTVAYATSGLTAGNNDFVNKTGTLTFNAGTTSRTITVNTTNDALNEENETLAVRLSGPVNAFVNDVEGVGTIEDNDPLPSLAISDVSKEEGASGTTAFVFTVSLSAASGRTVTANYATQDGTATAADNDYTAATGNISFAPGETTKQITVLVQGDEANEASETFLVKLTDIVGANAVDSEGTGTILNDDALVLSIGNVSQSEGTAATTTFTFTVSLSSPNGETVTVDYATADGSAAAPGDFVAKSGTLVFAPGVRSQTISIIVNNDALDEANEVFHVELSNPTGGVIGDGVADGEILDNDVAPTFTIADFSEPELNYNQAPFTVYVSLSAPSGQEVKVNFRTENGTATSTSNIKDYIDTLGTLVFAPGEVTKSFPVTIVGDIRHEADETLRVILSDPINASLTDTESIITILNDDIAYVTITGKTVTEPNSGTISGTVLVELSVPSDNVITINYLSYDDTAKAGQDYNAISGTLTFNPSEQSKTIPFQVKGDLIDELDEAFEIALTSQTGGATLPDYAETDVIIQDNDTAGLSVRDVSVVEGHTGLTNAVFTIQLSTAADRPITANYATSDFGALAGIDYQARSGVLSFAAGETSKTVTVPVMGDIRDEANERFKMTLTNPVGTTQLTRPVGYGTIMNDDQPEISIGDYTFTEGTGGTRTANVMVQLSRRAVSPITVNYATANGTAIAGSDFTQTSGVLNFAVGVQRLYIAIPFNPDNLDENNETFLVNLSGVTGQGRIQDGSATITLVDDDTSRFRIGDVSVVEGNAGTTNAVFTVTLTNPADRSISVQYATAPGTAGAADFTSTSGLLTFAANQTSRTLSVPIKGDTLDELNETFSVLLSNPTVGTTILDASALATIQDDDQARFSVADVTVTEPASGTANAVFRVQLSNPSDRPITVAYATANSTALSPADYTATSGLLTFAPGETSKLVSVAVKSDIIDEIDETFSFKLSAPTGGATLLDALATGRIVDADTSRISINNVLKDEGASGLTAFTFTVSLSTPNSQIVTVRYATANGTATTAGNDYVAANGTVTFAAGQTTKVVTIFVRGDRVAESNETFLVNLSNATNALILDAQGVGTIRNDDVAGGRTGDGEGEGSDNSPLAAIDQVFTQDDWLTNRRRIR